MATKLPKLEGAGTAKINIRGEWFTDNNPVTTVNVYYNITYKMSTVLQVLINSSFQLQQSYSWAQRVQSPPYLQPLCDLPWDWVLGHYTCATKTLFFFFLFSYESVRQYQYFWSHHRQSHNVPTTLGFSLAFVAWPVCSCLLSWVKNAEILRSFIKL